MPSPNVLDLSPTENRSARQFGQNLIDEIDQGYGRKQERDFESEYTGEGDEDPIQRLDRIERSRLDPEAKKRKMDTTIKKGELLRQKSQDEKAVNEENYKKKLGYFDKRYAEPLKQTQQALKLEYDSMNPDMDKIEALNQLYQKQRAEYDENVTKFAPEGWEPPQAEGQAQEVAQIGEAPPQGEPQASRPPIKITPDNLARSIEVAKKKNVGNYEAFKRDAEFLVDEAYPNAVPAKKDRLIREASTNTKIKPSPTEIKQLKAQDNAQKKDRVVIEKSIQKYNNPEAAPSEFTSTPDQLVTSIMDAFNYTEEEALSSLEQSIDFEYVSEEEQIASFKYWEEHLSTRREASTTAIQELQQINHERWKEQKGSKGPRTIDERAADTAFDPFGSF